MQKSTPPPSNIGPTLSQRISPPPSNGDPAKPKPLRSPHKKSLSTQFAGMVRWLHIYVSLLGFTALIFFSITGITLNHPSWFGVEKEYTTEMSGDMNAAWLKATGTDAEGNDQIAKLEIVEHLRSKHGIRGAVSGDFRLDEAECGVVFKGPGYSADTTIDRSTGKYTVNQTVLGTVAVLNDLHKGRDSGLVWSLVIVDGTALLTIFVSVTGVILLFYLRRKRWSGILTAVAGTIALFVIYAMGVQ